MRDTIEMAREAGFTPARDEWVFMDMLKAFEALVRADERERMYGKDIDTLLFEEHRLGFEKGSRSEREACAKVCDEESSSLGGVAEGPFVTDFGKHTHMSMAAGAQNCAAAIRARGEAK